MLRGIVLFLIGVAVGGGIFGAGLAGRISHAFGGSSFSSAPLVLRVGSSLQCSPQYAVFNRSDDALYFAVPGTRENIVKIPPGASMEPSGLVQPLIPAAFTDVADEAASAGVVCPAIRIELAES